MTDGDGTITYTYDDASRLIERDTPENTVDFSYDNANRLHIRTLVGVGTTTITYDNASRVTSIAVPGATATETTAYTYDAVGRQLTATMANGDVENDTYSATTADITNIAYETSSSATIVSYAYTYDSDGRQTQVTLPDGSYYTYTYDSNSQLTGESLNSGGTGSIGALHGYAYTYTYDAAENRATKYNGSTTESYTYDNANKLTAAGVKSYTYDNAGNCVSVYNSSSGVTVSLSYDAESRMIAASDSASIFSNTYAYNGLAQRVGKVDNGGTFSFTRVADDVDASVLSDGNVIYNQGIGLISEVRGGASAFYHSDSLGTTGALTSSSGSTTGSSIGDAFGNTVAASGTTASPFKFVGQGGGEYDGDTGLTLLGHRYYDSSTGRFLSRDPIQDGENWYTYCDNSPVNAIDTDGLVKIWLDWEDDSKPPFLNDDLHSYILVYDDVNNAWYRYEGGPTGNRLNRALAAGGQPIKQGTPTHNSVLLVNLPNQSAQQALQNFDRVGKLIDAQKVSFSNGGANCHSASRVLLEYGLGFTFGDGFEENFPTNHPQINQHGDLVRYPIQGWSHKIGPY